MHLIEWLKKYKKTQSEFTRETGISHSTLNNIVKKKKKVNFTIAKMIELYTKGEVTEKELRERND